MSENTFFPRSGEHKLALSRRNLLQAAGLIGIPLSAIASFASPVKGGGLVPFKIDVPRSDLNDLKLRLDNVRWPERETVSDASQGSKIEKVKALVDDWRTQYDWRRVDLGLESLPAIQDRDRRVGHPLPSHPLPA